MKLILFFFNLFIFQSLAIAADNIDISHPFHLLPYKKYELATKLSYYQEEHEYEKNKIVQDKFVYKNIFYKINLLTGLPEERQLDFSMTYTDRGRLDKTYHPSTGINNQSFPYNGFYRFELTFQEHLKMDNSKNKLAVEIYVNGSPFSAKETNNIYAGKDIALSLLYSHRHKDMRIFGKLTSKIIGRKKIQKFDQEKEIISAYALFGNQLGVQWLKEKYWFTLSTHFHLTTDYTSKSRNYNRLTDKGFMIGGAGAFGYLLKPNIKLFIEHNRESSHFNVINEDVNARTEFEIETEETLIGAAWLF